jgi:hypothetical protein
MQARNWGIYEYNEGFIRNEGRAVSVVRWKDIVSLEKGSRATARLSLSEITTYTVWLKDGQGLVLTTNYNGIMHLIASIEVKLAEAKHQYYPDSGVTVRSEGIWAAVA